MMLLNMNVYNSTVNFTEGTTNPESRGNRMFSVNVPANASAAGVVDVQRLVANGTDARNGISWDGWSYAIDLDGGLPSRLLNVTVGETASISGGIVKVDIPDAQAVMLSFRHR